MAINQTLSILKKFIEVDLWKVKLSTLPWMKRFWYRSLRILIISFIELKRDRISEKASSLTYYSLLSIIPILAITFGIAKGFGLDAYLERELNHIFIGQEEILILSIGFTKKLLGTVDGGAVIGISVVFILYSVLRLLDSIELTFDEIWHTKSRNWQNKLSNYLAIVLLAPLLLVLSGSITVFITSEVRNIAEANLLDWFRPFILRVIEIVPYLLVALLFTVSYSILPNIKVRFVPAIVSGIIAGISFQLAQTAWINGQAFLSNYSVVYGTLAVLPLFMIYLQISWMIVLFGAECAYAIQHADSWQFKNERLNMSQNYRRKLTILVFYHVIKNFQNDDNKALSISEISGLVGVPFRFVSGICEELEKAQFLVSIIDEDFLRYQPASDINQIDLYKLLSTLDRVGYEELKSDNDSLFAEIDSIMNDLGDAMKFSKANKLLKDL
jgi:membrane protein